MSPRHTHVERRDGRPVLITVEDCPCDAGFEERQTQLPMVLDDAAARLQAEELLERIAGEADYGMTDGTRLVLRTYVAAIQARREGRA